MPTPASDYESPPVIEVVCGVYFAPLVDFKVVHLGMLWSRFRDQFPDIEEHSPVAAALENLALPDGTAPRPEFQLLETPPLPRTWFVDATGNRIIQFQRDAFLHNWRKLKDEDQYPKFRSVIADYREQLAVLISFLEESRLGTIKPVQYEMTYINHIPESEFWANGRALSRIFPDFAWRERADRFLPAYESANWKTAFRLPDSNGRLHMTVQTAYKRPDNEPVTVFELKARGMSKDQSINSIWEWFDLAHTWIVRGFDDLTDNTAQQKLWGRK